MTPEVVADLVKLEPFSRIDAQQFPKHLPLEGVLLNDTRLLKLSPNQIIVREGDYGNSAFLILRGKVRIIIDSLPRKLLGRSSGRDKNIFKTIARAIKRSPYPEVRVHHTEREHADAELEGVFLQDVPRLLENRHSVEIPAGELFGEIAALGRSPRTATIIAADEGTEVLEIRWQGLRDLMNFAPDLNAFIEERFRQNGLLSLLNGLDMIRRLPVEEQEEITAETKFERYGKFDWYGTFEQLLEQTTATERLEKEPLMVREGDYVNGLLIVRGGFVRVSRKYNNGEQTISYLGKGQHFGLAEILHNHENPDDPVGAQNSLRAVGYVDVLLIPSNLVDQYIVPQLTEAERKNLIVRRGRDIPSDDVALRLPDNTRSKLGPAMIEFFMDKRAINGTAAMLIDLSRCTRCDDCVRACASTHDGNPRFIRQGDQREGIQITQACMHCYDPICMIPCPTGAIHRLESGDVVVNDDTCIGCAFCADNCPYNNIQMVQIRDSKGNLQYPVKLDAQGNIVRDEQGKVIQLEDKGPVLRSTKCDLCSEHVGGPACARACPHDALIRLDMQNTEKLSAWLSR